MSTLWSAARYRRFCVLRCSRELLEPVGPAYATWLDWLGAIRQVLGAQFLPQLASRPWFERSLLETVATLGSRGACKTLAAISCMEPSAAGAAWVNPGRQGSNSLAHQASTVRAPHPSFWGLRTSGGAR